MPEVCATGSNIAVIKETEISLDPASFSVGRFAIAALMFAPFLKHAFKQPGLAKAGLELGVWSGIAYLAQAVGLMTTDAGRASFFTTFSVCVSSSARSSSVQGLKLRSQFKPRWTENPSSCV